MASKKTVIMINNNNSYYIITIIIKNYLIIIILLQLLQYGYLISKESCNMTQADTLGFRVTIDTCLLRVKAKLHLSIQQTQLTTDETHKH